jgi:CRISPR/Cas system-associated protein Cas7 (RAMP superfamily)
MDTESQYNRFVGKMTIDSLRRGDLYKIYYKKNNIKTGVFEYDVVEDTILFKNTNEEIKSLTGRVSANESKIKDAINVNKEQ